MSRNRNKKFFRHPLRYLPPFYFLISFSVPVPSPPPAPLPPCILFHAHFCGKFRPFFSCITFLLCIASLLISFTLLLLTHFFLCFFLLFLLSLPFLAFFYLFLLLFQLCAFQSGSGIFIPDPNFSGPGSRVKKIPDPGSRSASASKNLSIFNPKICF